MPAIALAALALGPPAQAQVEEIVVTSERRAQSLQEVPAAVTALTEEVIERERVEELADIALLTPNFTIGQPSPVQPELTIRGIGSTDREAGSDRSVVVFVDEVYIGRAGASTFDLFDLERIEVLRGPQGTLYGRNVVGGVVNLISAKPTEDPRAKFELGVGSWGMAEAKGLVSGALGRRLNGKLAVVARRREGFFTLNLFDEDDRIVGTRNSGAPSSRSLRGQLYFEPREAGLEALLTLEASSDQVDGLPGTVSQGASPDADYRAAIQGFYPDGADVPGALPPPPYALETNIHGGVERDSLAVYAKLNLEKPYGTWTFIPAWRRNDLQESRDIVGIKVRDNAGGDPRGFESSALNDEIYTALSLEARLAAPQGRRLGWVAGLYLLDEAIDRDQIRQRQLNRTNSRPLFDQSISARSAAVFGQLHYALAPGRLNLTLGGRFTRDDKSFDMAVVDTLTDARKSDILARCEAAAPPDPPVCQRISLNLALDEYRAAAAGSWSEFTPRLSLDYRASENLMVYGTFSQGFKSGGFGGLAADAARARQTFAPETADNLEFGVKARLAGGRLQLDASYFDMGFEDLQLRRRQLRTPGDQTSAYIEIINAAAAEISGLELEVRAAPSPYLSLSAALATLDGRITQATAVLQVGKALPRSPKRKWTLGMNGHVPLGGVGELEIGGTWAATGDFYYDINEQPAAFEPGFGLLNLHLNYHSGGGWSAGLWVKNLTDELYRSHVQALGADRSVPGSPGRYGLTQYGDPMTLGVTFRMRFGY